MPVHNRQQALSVLHATKPGLDRFGVRELSLFGSFARDDMLAESDVDVLIDFNQTPDFRTYLEVRDALALALGRPVDLVMVGAVKPRMRREIEREAVRVA